MDYFLLGSVPLWNLLLDAGWIFWLTSLSLQKILIYLFLAVLSLHCCLPVFSSCTSLAALCHVESPWTRDRTHVPCFGRWILYCWTTRDVFLAEVMGCYFWDQITKGSSWVLSLALCWVIHPRDMGCHVMKQSHGEAHVARDWVCQKAVWESLKTEPPSQALRWHGSPSWEPDHGHTRDPPHQRLRQVQILAHRNCGIIKKYSDLRWWFLCHLLHSSR